MTVKQASKRGYLIKDLSDKKNRMTTLGEIDFNLFQPYGQIRNRNFFKNRYDLYVNVSIN